MGLVINEELCQVVWGIIIKNFMHKYSFIVSERERERVLLVIELVILFLTKTFCVRTMNCFVFVGIPSSFFSASLMNVFLF